MILKSLILFIFITFGLFFYNDSLSCEIKIEIVKNKKEKYKNNETLILKVEIYLTHRICDINIKDTKVETSNVEILKEGKWNEEKMGVWVNYYKIKISKNKDKSDSCYFKVMRICPKTGGEKTIYFNVD